MTGYLQIILHSKKSIPFLDIVGVGANQVVTEAVSSDRGGVWQIQSLHLKLPRALTFSIAEGCVQLLKQGRLILGRISILVECIFGIQAEPLEGIGGADGRSLVDELTGDHP